MKNILLLALTIVFTTLFAFAQDELKARIEFEEAEAAYNDSKFETSYEKLVTVEQLLGKWTPKVSYLKIKALDQVCTFDEYYFNKNEKELLSEIKKYIGYAGANSESIPIEKFKDIYNIEKKRDVYLRRFAQMNHPMYLEAFKARDKHDWPTATRLLTEASENGNTSAMVALGNAYEKGEMSLIKDEAKALEYYKKAAIKGDVWVTNNMRREQDAQNAMELGNSYYLTTYEKKNYVKAVQYYKQAYEAGRKEAAGHLRDIYATGGWYLYPDKLESKKWADLYDAYKH